MKCREIELSLDGQDALRGFLEDLLTEYQRVAARDSLARMFLKERLKSGVIWDDGVSQEAFLAYRRADAVMEKR